MRYDIHTHAFHPKIADKVLNQLKDHYSITPVGTGIVADLVARAQNAGLDHVVIHTAATTPAQVLPANNWSLEIMREHPEVLAFGTMHPGFKRIDAELDRLEQAGVAGLKFHADFQGFRLDDPSFYNLLERVAGRFVCMFHVGDNIEPDKAPSCPRKMAAILDAFPSLTAIAAHLGGYLHWNESLKHLAGRDVYLDTSSSLPFIDPALARNIVDRHPRERLLFGSDYPLFDPGDETRLLGDVLGFTIEEIVQLQKNGHGLFPD